MSQNILMLQKQNVTISLSDLLYGPRSLKVRHIAFVSCSPSVIEAHSIFCLFGATVHCVLGFVMISEARDSFCAGKL